ncbi:hypothetical protein O0I10_003085 [Lichtheimia ornata]|uniref:TFIIS central domain-containing protein n=1 Tax=Lichtheimia ornata TaxID=688661 RepID=A0AAD7VAK2_9FUNG|nr:uncharacterized protein O0I10_003085 [Lichtheimia ornata]KAJ8661335.1 hypothetical protein O0I10_003085 [Lichtheimia ornata]
MDQIRRKSAELLEEALCDSPAPAHATADEACSMAKCIEKEIYAANHNQINNEYKESIRSHIYNLRDTKNPLRQHVLSGSISPAELAHMTTKDMASPELRLETEQLRRRSIADSMEYDTIQPRHREQDNPDEDKQ